MPRTGAAALEIIVSTLPVGAGDRYFIIRSNADLRGGSDPDFESAVAAARSNPRVASVSIERSDPVSGGSEKAAVFPKRRYRGEDRRDPPRFGGRLPRRAVWQQ